jgi:DNA repair protein RecO (recombination protein O)
MKQIVTTGIVLSRTDYGEADRILTFLTPDHGKVRAIAKGVRRQKSKLAGGIELLSVSNITYIPGRGEIGTLISTRLIKHYGSIVQDIDRTMQAYDFIKLVNKITEDPAGEEYFDLLKTGFAGLDNQTMPKDLVTLWFDMQLLKITGHTPNLTNDSSGQPFDVKQTYIFSFDDMAFIPRKDGPHSANLIKLFRLAYATDNPLMLGKVQGGEELAPIAVQLIKPLVHSAFGL